MVSFLHQSSPRWPVGKNLISPDFEFESLSSKKKRKRSEEEVCEFRSLRPKGMDSLLGFELPLMTPLPLEWQRCLDIKSGQVYFYNTKTQEKTSRDPRLSPEPVSLDLELNLLCGSSASEKRQDVGDNFTKDRSGGFLSLARSPSWLAFDGDQKEMVTAVCNKCHMLVMVCKSTRTCPNCKFVNLPAAVEQKSLTAIVNQGRSIQPPVMLNL